MNKNILFFISLSLSSLLVSGQDFYNSPLSSKSVNMISRNEPGVTITIETPYNQQRFKNSHPRLSKPTDFFVHIPSFESIILQYEPAENYIRRYAIHRYDSLTLLSKSAIKKAPKWLQCDLRDLLIQLDSTTQDKWAKCITDAKDPYVDEIAFSIANLSPAYLTSTYAYPEMFTLNAKYLYKYDSIFPYVRIIDYGNSNEGGNYYSTTKYREMDSNGNIYENEIPAEIYYWYVVHPKISDEVPGFIDPEITENPINSGLTTPKDGKFWRTYMLEHGDPNIPNTNFGIYQQYVDTNSRITAKPFAPESSYKALALYFLDTLQTINYTWDDTIIHGMGTCYRKNHVMAAINRYVASTMHFWSTPQERPHQPVRILRWGVGRCGEHEDLTAAIGRSALIPSAGVEATSSDHVWNAFFFDGKWWPWEPVNGFVGRDFPDGNGNRWASVNHRRSDGITAIDVARDYSNQVGTIRVKVTDRKNIPIDGAAVVLYAQQASGTGIFYDNTRNTDHTGIAEFEVGNGRIYFAKVYALGQEKPTGNYVTQVTSGAAVDSGKIYTSTFKFSTITLDGFSYESFDTTTNMVTDTFLRFDIAADNEFIYGRSNPDDLGIIQVREHRNSSPSLSFFRLNEKNYRNFIADTAFSAYLPKPGMTQLDTIVYLGRNSASWFVIRNNYNTNYVCLTGEITFSNGDTSISIPLGTEDTIFRLPLKPKPFEILNIYPNPSDGRITIQTSGTKDLADLTVYDILGHVVFTHHFPEISEKTEINLKGVLDGIYFVILTSKNQKFCKKLIVSGNRD